jgi:hypothetical protein
MEIMVLGLGGIVSVILLLTSIGSISGFVPLRPHTIQDIGEWIQSLDNLPFKDFVSAISK